MLRASFQIFPERLEGGTLVSVSRRHAHGREIAMKVFVVLYAPNGEQESGGGQPIAAFRSREAAQDLIRQELGAHASDCWIAELNLRE
jgi:hypothetical protein